MIACGLAELASARFDRAAAAIHEALARQPDLARTRLDIRASFSRSDDLAARMAELNRRHSADPKDADALLVLGFVQFFGGAPEQGRGAFDQYIALRPDDTPLEPFMDQLHAGAKGPVTGSK